MEPSANSKKISYQKLPKTLCEQVELLISRGLQVPDAEKARFYLSQLNYYRFTAYCLPFQQSPLDHRFIAGTTFDDVLNLYAFDRELRLLILDAIERVEVSVRTRFAYALTHNHGSHAHLNAALFKAKWNHTENCERLLLETKRSREAFVLHYLNKYQEKLPPLWVSVEIMTFGQLSKWYANLSSGADRNAIAHGYDMDEVNLVSFLHHLSVIRNHCAHHSRLWNREFNFTFKLPRKRPAALVDNLNHEPGSLKRIYNTLVVLVYLMDQVSPESKWKQRVKSLITNSEINVKAMGFPEKWQGMGCWKLS